MKISIFGLTITSSWGNGHATLWRGLCRSLADMGHDIVFFERDVPYYASTRDLPASDRYSIVLYSSWEEIVERAEREAQDSDVVVVTSYCPDAIAATSMLSASSSGALRIFYDLDAPVTLDRLMRGETVDYIPTQGLGDFDLVLSYTGGKALDELQTRLGAKSVAPLYGSVDPLVHRPVAARDEYRCDLSYLGTFAADRQEALEELFIEPARRRSDLRFIIAGAMYPAEFPWCDNIWFVRHLPPLDHPAFFSSSRLTLNVTRAPMAAMGYCPSGRLFEAAACGVPMISDSWEGLETFFTPRKEIVIATSREDTIAALSMTDAELGRLSRSARERVLSEHTNERRASELVALIESHMSEPTALTGS